MAGDIVTDGLVAADATLAEMQRLLSASAVDAIAREVVARVAAAGNGGPADADAVLLGRALCARHPFMLAETVRTFLGNLWQSAPAYRLPCAVAGAHLAALRDANAVGRAAFARAAMRFVAIAGMVGGGPQSPEDPRVPLVALVALPGATLFADAASMHNANVALTHRPDLSHDQIVELAATVDGIALQLPSSAHRHLAATIRLVVALRISWPGLWVGVLGECSPRDLELLARLGVARVQTDIGLAIREHLKPGASGPGH